VLIADQRPNLSTQAESIVFS